MRSPLAYPLTRPVDGDAGGAADLQTDIMRFMAILALCLVAIFALVQSIPLAPVPVPGTAPDPVPMTEAPLEPVAPAQTPTPAAPSEPEPATVVLTRSRWTPKFVPETRVNAEPLPQPIPTPEPVPVEAPVVEPAAMPAPEQEGFTLTFASDHALMRLVAAGRVGLYAMSDAGAWRMTVTDSRVSFWQASTPNAFHEMEAATVPPGVVRALAQSGGDGSNVQWGVTLPSAMRSELDGLMRSHAGGNLKIRADGRITHGAES